MVPVRTVLLWAPERADAHREVRAEGRDGDRRKQHREEHGRELGGGRVHRQPCSMGDPSSFLWVKRTMYRYLRLDLTTTSKSAQSQPHHCSK